MPHDQRILPSRNDLTRQSRRDVPNSAFPKRVSRPPPPATKFSTATAWLGRVGVVVAALLAGLVLIAIHKGLLVQASGTAIVDNFTTANEFFAERADLTAPERARQQLEQLRGVLAELNTATAADVDQLAALLPDTQAIATAGRSDVEIATQLQGITGNLSSAAASLNAISTDADATVTSVTSQLDQALGLIDQLNAELVRTTDKLGPIPGQANLIPAPTGDN